MHEIDVAFQGTSKFYDALHAWAESESAIETFQRSDAYQEACIAWLEMTEPHETGIRRAEAHADEDLPI